MSTESNPWTERLRSAGLSTLLLCSALLWGCGGSGSAPISEEAIQQNILGTAYLGQQKWAEAEAAFRQAVELRGDADPRPLNNLAVALMQQGRTDEAQELLEESLAADPDFSWAHFNLGLIYKNTGEFDKAASHFESVAANDPSDLLTQYNLGVVLSRTERLADAERSYRKALELNPTHVSTLYGLGRLLLQRGEQEEGARLVGLSQEIRARSGLDEAVGTQYGEQGPYAMGSDYPGDALAAPEAIPVTFSATAQLAAQTSAFTQLPLEGGSALVTLDDQRLTAWDATGTRIDFPSLLPEGSSLLALDSGDFDNDGLADLVVFIYHAERLYFGVLQQTQPHEGASFAWWGKGLRDIGVPVSDDAFGDLTVVDFDHDGDLDLFGCWNSTAYTDCGLAAHDGAGNFTLESSQQRGFDGTRYGMGPVKVAFSDLDNDRDIDLLVQHIDGLDVLTNQRDRSFKSIGTEIGLGKNLPQSDSMQIVDLNKDGWMDLVVATQSGAQLWANRYGSFSKEPALDALSGAGTLVVFDYDNDGLLDIAKGKASGGTQLWRNLGASNWTQAKQVDGLPGVEVPRGSADVDGDGDNDLIAWSEEGGFRVYSNEGGNANEWIAIRSRGVGDNRFGVGAKVEVLAGALRQKYEIQSPEPLIVGLGQRTSVESVRYLWPSGVLQDEVQQSTGALVEIEQLDRKGTSCPLLYAWDGAGWKFVTDFLGGAAIGYQKAPGVFSVPDTDEYIKLGQGLAPAEDGTLRVRLNNQLEEVIWFDQVELIVIDHPPGSEVFPNERLMPAAPFPEFKVYASDQIRPVAAARTLPAGADVRAELLARDESYVVDFEKLPPKGYATSHTLELDLGPLPRNEQVVLLLDGWIDYADSSANVSANQSFLQLEPPRLWVADGKQGWIETEHLMGFPAGLPKTMTLDLSGQFPSDDTRVRIRTNMRIYWDRARVLLGSQPTQIQRLAPLRASLSHGGFPQELRKEPNAVLAYDPNKVEPFRHWKAHVGRYTAFGDVQPHLAAIDDWFVTTRNGDQVEIAFAAPAPPAAGYIRSYLVFADGFGKDMDPNSAVANTVGPLPFHNMPYYPYGSEVTPPTRPVETSYRAVLDDPRGLPGAVPQAYVAHQAEESARSKR